MRLVCRELNFTYPNSRVKVIGNLCFSMAEPGFNAVFGSSGAGKTSFARILAGQIPSYQGDLQTEGIKTILYSYNLERLPGWTSIGDHLHTVTSSDKTTLLQELISIFALQDLLKARFAQLSLGQQNRINLIRYLVQDFDLLILDESLANVDEQLRQRIILQIKQLFPDKMFLSISHNLMEVATLCKDILVLGSSTKHRLSQGLNQQCGEMVDKERLDHAMLEIMNAF